MCAYIIRPFYKCLPFFNLIDIIHFTLVTLTQYLFTTIAAVCFNDFRPHYNINVRFVLPGISIYRIFALFFIRNSRNSLGKSETRYIKTAQRNTSRRKRLAIVAVLIFIIFFTHINMESDDDSQNNGYTGANNIETFPSLANIYDSPQ